MDEYMPPGWTGDREFGRRLQAARDAAGLSQTELGRRAKVSQSTVNSLEQGRRGLTVAVLKALAAVLGVTQASLLGEAPAPPARLEIHGTYVWRECGKGGTGQ